MNIVAQNSHFTKVSSIQIPSTFYKRMRTGIEAIDKIFGEGILPGSTMTLTAQAGCGKTTFLLQLAEALVAAGYSAGYASGEESQYQLAYTCKRLNVNSVQVANESDISALAKATKHFDILIVDSFQALTSGDLSKSEIEKQAVSTLIKAAKDNECVLIFIMHLTKDGKLKGSSLIPHSVDVNIQLKKDDDDSILRIFDVYKNRFGTIGEYVATMTATGLDFSTIQQPANKEAKRNDKSELYRKILELDPPLINKSSIMQMFNLTGSQAYLALKELVDCGKLIKMGRGSNAVWKKPVTS